MAGKPAYVSRGSDYWPDVKARLQEEEVARLKRRTEALEEAIIGVSETFYHDGLVAARDAIAALIKKERS